MIPFDKEVIRYHCDPSIFFYSVVYSPPNDSSITFRVIFLADMLLFEDVLSGDEMFSDAFPVSVIVPISTTVANQFHM